MVVKIGENGDNVVKMVVIVVKMVVIVVKIVVKMVVIGNNW